MIGQTIAHDKILEKLGGGGMGVVCKALDLNLDRLVALKFLPPDLTRDPEAKRRSTYEALPCGDGKVGRGSRPAAISLTHATIAIRHPTMKRQERVLSDSCLIFAAHLSCHEEVFHVSAACSDSR